MTDVNQYVKSAAAKSAKPVSKSTMLIRELMAFFKPKLAQQDADIKALTDMVAQLESKVARLEKRT